MYLWPLVFVCVVSMLCAPVLAENVVRNPGCPVLDASNARQREALLEYVCYLVAAPQTTAFAAANPNQLPPEDAWVSANGRPLVFDETSHVYWLRLNIRNGDPSQNLWYLKLNYPQLDEVTFWSTSRGLDRPLVTGDTYPFFSRVVDYRYFLLPIELQGNASATITIRVHSRGALNIPLSLEPPNRALGTSNHLTLSQGLFYGALLIFALFNLLLYAGSRMLSYLHNAFYLVSLGMFLFAMGGFASQYFWPGSPRFANSFIPAVMAICLLSMPLFARSFLEIQPRTILNRLLIGQILIGVVLFVQVFILPYDMALIINSSAGVLLMAGLSVIGMIRWFQGYTPAKWYVLACGSLFMGAATYALAAFDLMPAFLPTEAFLKPVVGQVAIGAQVLLLNYALVQHWQLINQRMLSAEQRARAKLEDQVHERTAQLNSAMDELREANRQLMSLSLDDALTGLRNRRYLDQVLPELCREARRTAQPLTVAILDADHFKRLNDTWGHDFGDQCLKHIADILKQSMKRPRDTAVRFGGEEFALLLPDTDERGAINLCSRILSLAENSPLLAPGGQTVTLTLSSGVAMLAPGEEWHELFKRADTALYEAKSNGRNQVVFC